MYTEFFGLNEKPFAITPDPRYLYLSQRHADALAHLLYGVSESGGFIQLTGEVGTGKTTLIRSLLEQLPDQAQIALVLNPQLSRREFLQSICDELGTAAAADDSIKALVDRLNEHLLAAHAAGRRVVLIVDEAQTLSLELLEQVRLLTNLETPKHKLLQIILIGQPELRELLARADMRQVAQRITGRYHLEPLGREDTAAYVRHRLRVAGAAGDVFTHAALAEIYRRSGGIPRLINVLADRALLAGYALGETRIDRRLVRRSAIEVFGRARFAHWRRVAVAGALALVLGTAGALWLRLGESDGGGDEAVAKASEPSTDTAAVLAVAEPQNTEPASSLGTLLAEGRLSKDIDTALGELFTLWGADYDPNGATPCEQAEQQGLRCLFQHGSISELRRADRPAILTLREDNGDEYPIVLRKLNGSQVELLSAGRTIEVGVADLSYYWFGDQLLLWRPGIDTSHDLVPGARDGGVLWLRKILARIGGDEHEVADAASSLYDASLEARVREYQRSRHLTVDGIVGTQTQLALLSDAAPEHTPSLHGESEDVVHP